MIRCLRKNEAICLRKNNEAFILVCIVAFIIMLVIGAIFFYLILTNLVDIGIGCLTLTIPLAILVVLAILAKKHLFGGDKK